MPGSIATPTIGARSSPDDLAEHYRVDPSQLLIGSGSVNLLALAFAATVDEGDEVVFAWPSFEMYPILAQQTGAVAVRVPLLEQRHDLDAMADAITERTRLVFVCNPNNPTGTAVAAPSLTRFLERVPSDCLVVLDEAYREFVTAPDVPDGLDVLAGHDNVAVLRTFSKAYGLAALRVGYAIAHPDVIAALRKVAMPFRVNGLAQVAAVASLAAEDEMRERVDGVIAERARLLASLQELSLPVVPSEANFLWLDVPGAGRRARQVLRATRRGVPGLRRRRRPDHHRRERRERPRRQRARGRDRRRRRYSGTHRLTSSPMPSIAVRTI